jgi:CelD/BcsL family acetyltransferase involved in cellulose biosynthesis
MATDAISPRQTANRSRSLRCSVISDPAEAESLRPVWTDLLERSERNELTQTPDWLLTWWRVFGGLNGRQLRLGLFHDGDRLVGLAPLLRRRHWYRGWLPFRRLELLASGEPDGEGIFSNHIGIAAERGCEDKIANALAAAIAAGVFGSWDEVVLPMMSGDTAMPDRLVEAFRAAGYNAESTVTAGAPYIPLPATWDEYLQQLPSKQRKNLKRQLRLFDRWSGDTTELECIASPAELERGMKILIDLHHARWAGDQQTGVFRAPLFLRFHEEMMRRLAEQGAVEILVLRARGEPVAAIQSLIWAGKVSTYQTGRRIDVPEQLSVGAVVFALAIRRAIEQRRREFDMLADAVHYKLQLTEQVRPLVQVRAVRRCIVEVIRNMGRRFRATAKAEPREAP